MSSTNWPEKLYFAAYLCLGSFFLYGIVRTLYRAYATPLRNVPGPWLAKFTRLWLLKAISTREYQKINIELHRKYGPIVRIAPNEYSIDDPEAAQIIFRTKDQLVKAPRYEAFGLPGNEPDVFSTRDNEHNAQRRRQVLPLYQLSALNNIEFQFDSTTATFLDKMADFARNDTVIDITEWLQYYTFDAIGTLTFGKPFGFLSQGKDIAGMIGIIHGIVRYAALVGVYSEHHPLLIRTLQSLSSQGQVGIAYLYKFVADALAEWKTTSNEKQSGFESRGDGDVMLERDFMTSLMEKGKRDPAFGDKDAQYHLIAQIGAGGETTGDSLCAAVWFLGTEEGVLGKVRGEVDGLGREGGRIRAKDTKGCAYLQAFIKETLRLFPALGINLPRLVPKGGLTLSGRFFPEGTIVGTNMWVAHHNRSVFGEDADAFRPERWMESQERSAKMEGYFLTFGKGPRTCIGKGIALMELEKVIAEFVARFDVEFEDGGRGWKVRNDWFVKPEGLKVRIRERARDGRKGE